MLNAKTDEGFTPIHLAAFKSDIVIKTFVFNKKKLNIKCCKIKKSQ